MGGPARRPREVPGLPTRGARVARERDRRVGPGRGRGGGRRPEGRGSIRTKPSRPAPLPAAPAPRAAFPGAATCPPPLRAAPGPQLFPERPPPLAAADAGPRRQCEAGDAERSRAGLRGRGKDARRRARTRGPWVTEGDEGGAGPGMRGPSGHVRPGCSAGPGMRGRGVAAGRGRGCGADEGDAGTHGVGTRGRAGPRGCDAEETRAWRAVGAAAAGTRGRAGTREPGRRTHRAARGRARAVSSGPGACAGRDGGTAASAARVRRRGHERGAPARAPHSILGRPRAAPAATLAAAARAPPALPAAAAAENGVSRPSPGWPRPTMLRAA